MLCVATRSASLIAKSSRLSVIRRSTRAAIAEAMTPGSSISFIGMDLPPSGKRYGSNRKGPAFMIPTSAAVFAEMLCGSNLSRLRTPSSVASSCHDMASCTGPAAHVMSRTIRTRPEALPPTRLFWIARRCAIQTFTSRQTRIAAGFGAAVSFSANQGFREIADAASRISRSEASFGSSGRRF